jgi:two-component system cell cycle sensor histidine kinase/response regulator CckA
LRSSEAIGSSNRWERLGFVIALVTMSGVFALRLSLGLTSMQAPAVIFLVPPILFSAYLGGLRPGLLATALAVIGEWMFGVPMPLEALRILSLASTGLLISILVEQLHRARQLSEATQRLKTVTLASLGDAVVTTDVKGRVTFLNPEAERLTGWTQEAGVGRPIELVFQIVDEETRQPISDPSMRVLRTRATEPLSNHTILLGRHAVETPIEYKVSPITQSDSGIEGAVLVFRDCSRRKHVEAALRERVLLEERYRQIVNTAQEGIWTVDTDHKTTFVNPKMAAMLGYPVEEMIGVELFAFMNTEEKRIAVSSLQRHASTGGEELECTFRRKDGSPAWTVVNWTPIIDGTSRHAGVLAMVSDVSARKRKDEQARLQSAALNAAADAMLITDRAGTISWINPAFTDLTGYTVEEAIGKNPRALQKSGAHDPDFYRDMWNTILSGHVWRGEMTNRRKDGSVYPEHQSITPVKNLGGEISHFIAIKRDLTEERELQSQFLQAQKMEIVGRLAGGVAHDFNNLLTVINGTAEFGVMALKDNDPLRSDFQEIQQAGARAASLTRQLLAFSRRQIMQLGVLNLNPVVADMKGMLQRLIGEDIDLVVVPANDTGNVRADAGQIEQVVLNLAVNARDAMPQGGRVTIETRNVELDGAYAALHPSVKPGPYVMLAVTDTGTGMDAATRARIFEPFFTTKGPGKGTGLGLATVYGIVNQSGGSVRVYSELGRGTTFKVYLPRVDEAASSTHSTEARPLARGTETVLIVEDEEALRHLAARILESAGYKVLTARTGAAALQLMKGQNGSVQVVFTDVVMPEMGGCELAARLAEAHPGVKVLFSSGYTDDAVLRHGVIDNAAHFIGKPYTRVTLTRAIRDLLDQR